MYSFLPPLLIILSLVGIVVIVIRRTPELRAPESLQRAWVPLVQFARRLWRFAESGLKRFWQLVLEVKDASKPELKKLPKNFPKEIVERLPRFRRQQEREQAASSAEVFISRARDKMNENAFERAEELFIKAIKQDKHHEGAFAGLGELYFVQNKFPEAEETLRFLVKHHPKANYQVRLAMVLKQQDRADEAIEILEEVLQAEPTHRRARQELNKLKFQ